ncbi:MAG: hypothetical protein PUC15_09140 [Lentisphaeria bacterium]|nr:hypothetical protein [Lentisphaeria bacterium]
MSRYDVTSGVTSTGKTLNNDSMYVSSGGTAIDTKVNSGGFMDVFSGGTAIDTKVNSGGFLDVFFGGVANSTTVSSGGSMVVSGGGRLTGRMTFAPGANIDLQEGSVIDFDLTRTRPGADALINDYMFVGGNPSFTLTVDSTLSNGYYRLADMVEAFSKTITVVNTSGTELGTLAVGGGTQTIGGVDYTLTLNDDTLGVTVGAAAPAAAKGDIDGNGVSDVMFVWTGNNYAHGYWMNGTSEWQSANSNHPAEWENLGCYDMTGDGKADSVLVGNVEVGGVKGAYIGYYADANDLPDGSTWVNIGYLTNAEDYVWKNKVGNLTGGSANSIVWYAPELYALGAWTDGTDSWVTLSNNFGGDAWTLVGCGDFDGDGKDSVVMSYNGGEKYYAVNLDGTETSMGATNWSGWEVRAIGDFKGDGKDDMILFHQKLGSLVMLANGSLDDYKSIGQLDKEDWFVVGVGNYDANGIDDLLVRQKSTGMLGYYSSGDMAQWNTLGYGVDMNWTVIA